jgi:hypothetical protein
MSETAEPAAAAVAGRRRPSLVYDPARDVFQPTPDALSTVNEEKPPTSVSSNLLTQHHLPLLFSD